MNQEIELKRTDNSALAYFAPDIEVVEFKVKRIICQQSPNSPFTGGEVDDLG